LACAACQLSGLYILLTLIPFFLFLMCKAISGSTSPIFNKCLLYGSYLIADYRSDRIFPIAQGTMPWQPILGSKWAKSADSFSFVALAFQNGLEYRHSDF